MQYITIVLGSIGLSYDNVNMKTKITPEYIEEIFVEQKNDENIIENYIVQLLQLLSDSKKRNILNDFFQGIGDKLYISHLNDLLNQIFIYSNPGFRFSPKEKDENYDQEIEKIIFPIYSFFMKFLFNSENENNVENIISKVVQENQPYYQSLELIETQIKPLIESENYEKYKNHFSYFLAGDKLFHFSEIVIKMGFTKNIDHIDLYKIYERNKVFFD